MVGWGGGGVEKWRLKKLTSAKVEVEVEAELGKIMKNWGGNLEKIGKILKKFLEDLRKVSRSKPCFDGR